MLFTIVTARRDVLSTSTLPVPEAIRLLELLMLMCRLRKKVTDVVRVRGRCMGGARMCQGGAWKGAGGSAWSLDECEVDDCLVRGESFDVRLCMTFALSRYLSLRYRNR